MKLAASNSMQTTKPISVKRQGHRKTSLTTSGVPYLQNADQILNPGAFTCSDESSSGNLPNLSKSEKTPNVVYTYIDNYLKACVSSVEKKLFGKLDICFNKIQSLEAHANQNKTEDDNRLSQLLLLLDEDLIHLQTKLENEPIKYGETSIVKNAQEPLDFRTLAESILVVKISLELKINKLEKQLNVEREKIHTEVVKLKEICDRFKTRGNI
ncbi:unnamed protein product [Schistosoma curassoni]|nr:unnamed protein product [Schistosoma curassoni]